MNRYKYMNTILLIFFFENKNFNSTLHYKQNGSYLKIITLLENKHEGYKIDYAWTFSPKFWDLFGFQAPGPSPIMTHYSTSRFSNDVDVMHVFL